MGCSPAGSSASPLPYQDERVVDFQVYVTCFVLNVFLSLLSRSQDLRVNRSAVYDGALMR